MNPLNEDSWMTPLDFSEDRSDEGPLYHSSYSPDDTIGDHLPPSKPPNTTRIYFVNVNGISFGSLGGDFSAICTAVKEHGIDILGVAETKLDTHHPRVPTILRRAARVSLDTHSINLVLSSSNRTYRSTSKPGGTLLLTQGHTVGRTVNTFDDRMGRWSGTTYAGNNNSKVTVISAYQVCNSSPVNDTTTGGRLKKTTAATQQYSMMIEENSTAKHPREKFRIDLSALVKDLRQQNHKVILMGDFNEEFGSEQDGMKAVAAAGDLIDLMGSRLRHSSFSTYVGGTKRIDYVLASPAVVTACVHAGYDPFKYRFQGDHRGLYMDFDTAVLFGSDTPTLAPPSRRILSSKHKANRDRYLTAKHKYLKDHNWYDRLEMVFQSEVSVPEEIEKLDRDWVRASIHAEKQCTRHKAPPYVIELAQLRYQLQAVRIKLSSIRNARPFPSALQRALEKCPPTFVLPELQEGLEALQSLLKSKIRQTEKDAYNKRKAEQREILAAKTAAGAAVGSRALRNIIVAEETKEMWRQLRALEGQADRGVTNVQIPSDRDFAKCKVCTSWTNLEQPQEIQNALLKRNRLHFGQAQGTFPTVPPFSETVDWEAGTYQADLILDGTIPYSSVEIDEISELLLKHFQRTTALDSIAPTITEEEWCGKMNAWHEATTTSPSGLHLGHHKCLTRAYDIPTDQVGTPMADGSRLQVLEETRKVLLTAQVKLVNCAIKHQHVFERWKKVANFMILKEPGNTKIHRLRVIHLYEADLNLILGVKWRKLVHHGIDQHLFSPWQFGGLPGRDALTPAFLEEIQWETSRASRRSLLRMDFDATSCYDRIIPSIASLAGRSFGQHKALCLVHARFLAEAKYLLKTKLGISDDFFSHCQLAPIYGTGQGSANSPIIWVLISSRLFQAHASIAHGATFISPDRGESIQICMIGFVDDSNDCVNNFENADQSHQSLVPLARQDAQLWHDLLSRSGGALEVPKCAYHLAEFNFDVNGKPFLNHFHRNPPKIEIYTQDDPQPTSLQYISPYQARKTLGCWKCPSGGTQTAFKAILAKAEDKSVKVANSHLNRKATLRYFHAVFLPSVTYSFPVNTIPRDKLDYIQSKTYHRFLPKLGYNRNMPTAVVQGPKSLGGINLRPLYDEQGSGQIEQFIKHWRSDTGVSTQLRIMIAWIQKFSGMGTSLLEEPHIHLPHVNDQLPLISSIRLYLAATKSAILLDKDYTVPYQREGDVHLMELVINSSTIEFDDYEIKWINNCQHWLQVYTVSDLARACGTSVDTHLLHGRLHPSSSRSLDVSVHQGRPTSRRAWSAWAKAQHLWCNPDTGKLHQPLGKWLYPSSKLRRSWPFHLDKATGNLLVRRPNGTFDEHPPRGSRNTFSLEASGLRRSLGDACVPVDCSYQASYIKTKVTSRSTICYTPRLLPASDLAVFLEQQHEWIQQLVKHVKLTSHFGALLESFVATPALLGASDGSVVKENGTFGWVIATATGEVLAKCMGPAFGIPMNSFRAEGYGLLSLLIFLFLVHQYAKTSIPHVKLLCDNKALIEKVDAMAKCPRPQFPNETLDPSWDVLQQIQRLLRWLPQGYTAQWIKGHQDAISPAANLTTEAKLNIQADKLAGEFQDLSPSHSTELAPMIDGTKCHLVVDGQTICSNHRKAIRNVRPTNVLLKFMQDKYKWSDSTVDSIDWESHKAAVHAWPNALEYFPQSTPPRSASVHRPEIPIDNNSTIQATHSFQSPATSTERSSQQLREDTPLVPSGRTSQSSSTFLPKFLHRWLPTGDRVFRYDNAMYSKVCATCGCDDETNDHFLRCPGRKRWQSMLRIDLRKQSEKLDTDPILSEILLEGLQTWLNGTNVVLSPRYSTRYRTLIQQQTKIGWNQLFYGRWAKTWRLLQDEYLTQHNVSPTRMNHGSAWVQRHIIIIWQACHYAWQSRNADRHGFDEDSKLRIELENLQRRVRILYHLRPYCRLQEHRTWFHATPDEHFHREPSPTQLKQWLATYEPMIRSRAAQQNQLDQQGLVAIDVAFERLHQG